MNILVIGNGFDLAHGLPTKYSDFLDFVNFINEFSNDASNVFDIKEKLSMKELRLHVSIKKFFFDELTSYKLTCSNGIDTCIYEWKRLTENNVWIKYFNENIDVIGENWIDFEKEISIIIQGLDRLIKDKAFNDEYKIPLYRFGRETFNANRTFEPLYNPCCMSKGVDYKLLKKRLENDLNHLISAFERYLIEFVEEINPNLFSPDIMYANIDRVISFNYTNTFMKKYDNDLKIPIDFIHGNVSKNNIVLGIDEYLPPSEQNNNTEFNKFKKFYQIIYNDIAHEYKYWLKKFLSKSGNSIEHNLYIFGHSLDITDKEILKELILCRDVKTTVFYHNDEVKDKLISNMQRIIGQNELIKRTNYPNRTIVFREQAKLIDKESFDELCEMSEKMDKIRG